MSYICSFGLLRLACAVLPKDGLWGSDEYGLQHMQTREFSLKAGVRMNMTGCVPHSCGCPVPGLCVKTQGSQPEDSGTNQIEAYLESDEWQSSAA